MKPASHFFNTQTALISRTICSCILFFTYASGLLADEDTISRRVYTGVNVSSSLRLGVGLIGEIGRSINDTTSAYGSPMELRYQYAHMACVPRVLATLDIGATAGPFVSIGAGLHSMQIVEKIFSLNPAFRTFDDAIVLL